MKKITINGINYGPYNTVEVLDDRYRCDGADLPFSVVGEGVISDVVDGDFPPIVPPKVVPQSLTPRQIRMVLTANNLRTTVENTIATSTDYDLKDWWEYSLEYLRDNTLLINMATSLGLTSDQIDDMFIQGATL